NITLQKTKDILRSLGEQKKAGQVLIGFALETNNEAAHAKEKLISKKADMIVLNSLNDAGAGFGTDTNKITIFDKSGKQFDFEMKSKKAVAADIINSISSIYYA
ncbi:MAG: phosphopantothenoylcysteine decarboxylase, partial [Chitinophagaceae bacterium]|nr:phosphopantothenoylcysteine decarboxylase [Chitinophagaceae bacterium]